MDVNLNDLLEVKMAYSAERQKVLAQNIASVDIPGYQAKDLAPVDFNNILAAKVNQIELSTTSSQHLSGTRPHTQIFKTAVQSNTFERTPTGNTVVVEEQMMKVAKNAADYQLYTSLYKKVGNLFKEALGLQTS